jgi:DNA-directed RNA polymerase specialized sigma24 family protein
MTKDEIILHIYHSQDVIRYCMAICYEDHEELKSQVIIQLYNMPDYKLINAWNKNYIEYLAIVIAKRILGGRVKGSGDFYLQKKALSIQEGYGLDITEIVPEQNGKLERIESIVNSLHWYNKILFNYHYIDGYKLREIAEMTGINLKSIAYTIDKTRKEIKKQLKENGTDNN